MDQEGNLSKNHGITQIHWKRYTREVVHTKVTFAIDFFVESMDCWNIFYRLF